MLKKKSVNSNFNNYLTLIFLLMIFLIKLDFFKQLYFLSKSSYEQRMINKYGYCENDGYGFLKDIEKKFYLKENPKIINSHVIPESNWIIYDPKKSFSTRPTIFINYNANPSLSFFRSKENFITDQSVQYTNRLSEVIFKTNGQEISLKNNIKIFKKKNNKNIIIFQKFFEGNISNNTKIQLDIETEKFNSRWEKLFLEIENFKNEEFQKIKSISLNFKNKYEFNDKDIIFSEKNCYYIK